MSNQEIYIGLMSGTSIDSVDAAAITFYDGKVQLLGTHSHSIPEPLKQQIVDLCQPGKDNLQLLGETDSVLGELFAEACPGINDSRGYRAIAGGRHWLPRADRPAYTPSSGCLCIYAANWRRQYHCCANGL